MYADFGTRVYDVIIVRTKGLSWSCEGCTRMDINLQLLHLQTRALFYDIRKRISKLTSACEESVFNNCKRLDASSPLDKCEVANQVGDGDLTIKSAS